MRALLEAALEYARRGWYVFPVSKRSKRPITERGHYDATTDERQIRQWWRNTPDANIGVWLRKSGLIAVDVDVDGGKAGRDQVAALEAKYGALPRVCHQRTASGGEHVLLLDPSGDPDSVEAVPQHLDEAKHVDIKCNGYVLLAPSATKRGRYEWVSDAEPKTLPKDWARALDAARRGRRKVDPDVWRLSMGALSDRDDLALRATLLDLRRRDGGGATHKAVLAVFHDFGLSVEHGRPYLDLWNANCGDPHTARELDRQVERCATTVEFPRGWRRGMAAFERAVERFLERSRTQRAEDQEAFVVALKRARHDVEVALGTSEKVVPVPLFEPAINLFTRDYPPTPWLVRDLLTEGGTAIIATNPKSGKTWAATEIALAVATGTDAFGQFSTGAPRRVAYFYAEDGALSVRNRLRALTASRGMKVEDATRNLVEQTRGRYIDLCDLDSVALLIASCRQFGDIALLVIDPMRDVHSGVENDSDEMRDVMRALRVIGDLLGCTVLFVHHAAKASGEIRGSSAIKGAVDCILEFSNLSGDKRNVFSNTVKSTVKGARSAGEFDLMLVVEDNATGEAVRARWEVGSAAEAQRADGERQDEDVDRLVAYVQEHPGAPWSKIRTAKLCAGQAMNGRRIDAARERAIARGLLKMEKVGKAYIVRAIGGAK